MDEDTWQQEGQRQKIGMDYHTKLRGKIPQKRHQTSGQMIDKPVTRVDTPEEIRRYKRAISRGNIQNIFRKLQSLFPKTPDIKNLTGNPRNRQNAFKGFIAQCRLEISLNKLE